MPWVSTFILFYRSDGGERGFQRQSREPLLCEMSMFTVVTGRDGNEKIKWLSFYSIKITVCVCVLAQSVQLFATPWTVAHQAPLSMEYSRQECWSGLPFPPPGDLRHRGIKPESPVSPALAGRFFTTESLEK